MGLSDFFGFSPEAYQRKISSYNYSIPQLEQNIQRKRYQCMYANNGASGVFTSPANGVLYSGMNLSRSGDIAWKKLRMLEQELARRRSPWPNTSMATTHGILPMQRHHSFHGQTAYRSSGRGGGHYVVQPSIPPSTPQYHRGSTKNHRRSRSRHSTRFAENASVIPDQIPRTSSRHRSYSQSSYSTLPSYTPGSGRFRNLSSQKGYSNSGYDNDYVDTRARKHDDYSSYRGSSRTYSTTDYDDYGYVPVSRRSSHSRLGNY